jgi:hypothetical protein
LEKILISTISAQLKRIIGHKNLEITHASVVKELYPVMNNTTLITFRSVNNVNACMRHGERQVNITQRFTNFFEAQLSFSKAEKSFAATKF